MKDCLTRSLRLLGLSLLLCCVIYPTVILTAGQLLFPFESNGSLLTDARNQPVASQWIAQAFTEPTFFHPRPSASGYNTMPSSSSSLAPSSPALRDNIGTALTTLLTDFEKNSVPADAVMTSASGLDPCISYENASAQLARVSKAWARRMNADPEEISKVTADILEQNTSTPLAGWAGDRIVNVITANWMLYRHFVDTADE